MESDACFKKLRYTVPKIMKIGSSFSSCIRLKTRQFIETRCGINPVSFLQSSHHDDGVGPLFPDHPPEVGEGVGQRSLGGDVGARSPVAVQVVGVDVVACGYATGTTATCRTNTSQRGHATKCEAGRI